jgi:hypothetical protein
MAWSAFSGFPSVFFNLLRFNSFPVDNNQYNIKSTSEGGGSRPRGPPPLPLVTNICYVLALRSTAHE